jgi:hypothetical protein
MLTLPARILRALAARRLGANDLDAAPDALRADLDDRNDEMDDAEARALRNRFLLDQAVEEASGLKAEMRAAGVDAPELPAELLAVTR